MAPSRRLPATLVVAAALAFGAATPGCGREPRTSLSYSADAKRAYDEAMVELRDHNWIEAQALFREVKRKYTYSRYAKLAELRIADADMEQEKYIEAIRGYRQYIHDHRADAEEVGYCRGKIAEAQYKQISESILVPSADERDQAIILESYRELRSYLQDYPTTKEAIRLKELLVDVTARLMRHEIYVARFYLKRDNYDAAVLRLTYAMRTYGGVLLEASLTSDPEREPGAPSGPAGGSAGAAGSPGGPTSGGSADPDPNQSEREARGARNSGPGGRPRARRKVKPAPTLVASGLEAEALLLLGETYLRMHRFDEARGTFGLLKEKFPESPFIVQADNFLEHMNTRGI